MLTQGLSDKNYGGRGGNGLEGFGVSCSFSRRNQGSRMRFAFYESWENIMCNYLQNVDVKEENCNSFAKINLKDDVYVMAFIPACLRSYFFKILKNSFALVILTTSSS